MKKISFLILTILSLSTTAQTATYHPFPDSNAIWRQEGGDGGNFNHWRQEFYLNGDTLINSNVYHKVFGTYVYEHSLLGLCFPIMTVPTIYYHGYYGAIRDDVSQKKIFYIPMSENNDGLLYSFDLNLGDTIPNSINHSSLLTVIKVDSFFDGSNYRRQLFLSSTFAGDSVSLIEGIGSTRGLFSSLEPFFEVAEVLHCFIQDGFSIYQDWCPLACDSVTLDSKDLNSISPIEVYPNPFHLITQIRLSPEFVDAELIIFNLFGQQIKQQKISFRDPIIHCENLSPGIYFFKLDSHRTTSISKLVVE